MLWIAGPVLAAPAQSAIHAAQNAAIILARPLFSKDRRPLPQPHGAASAGSDSLPRLSGIVIASSYRRAIFDNNGRHPAYREGERIGVYTVLAIASQQVTLAGPDGQQTIGLSFDANRPNMATPVASSGGSIIDRLNSRKPFRPAMPKMPTPEEFQARMAQRTPQTPN